MADELRWIATTTSASRGNAGGGHRKALSAILPWVLATAAVIGAVAWRGRAVPPASPVRAQLPVDPAGELFSGGVYDPIVTTRGGSRTALAWLPAGNALVFVGRRAGVKQLYVRDLASAASHPLAGTEGAQVPAVSPDGRWIVFWADDDLKRVPAHGGPVETVAAAVGAPPMGMTVGVTGRIVFSRDNLIWQAGGGSPPKPLTSRKKGERAHVLPQLLGDDTVLLYTVRTSSWTWGDERTVAQMLSTGERKDIVSAGADARYTASNHLVFLRRGQLLAAPFDLSTLSLTKEPVAVVDDVSQSLSGGNGLNVTGAGQYAVSDLGVLAYVRSPPIEYPQANIVTVTRRGEVSPLAVERRSYGPTLGLSRDGRRLAVPVVTLDEHALWLFDLARGAVTRLAVDGETGSPRWTPDGRRIARQALAGVRLDHDRTPLRVRPSVSGEAAATPISAAGGGDPAWSPRGDELFFTEPVPSAVDLYRMMVIGVQAGRIGTARPLFEFRNTELGAKCVPTRCYEVTPDGRGFLIRRRDPASSQPPVTHVELVLNWFEELKAKVPVK